MGGEAWGADVDADAHFYMRSGKTRGGMIAPAFEEWVAKQFQSETAAVKGMRKLREDAARAEPSPKRQGAAP